jgi:NAD(P)-dependent dehydrogenase (short-subunit alcohol dehydrogenase family)
MTYISPPFNAAVAFDGRRPRRLPSRRRLPWTTNCRFSCGAALPHLKPGSAIIATASERAYDPLAGPLRLRPDQGGDDELCEVAGQTAARTQHSVNAVAPGPIWTPLQVSGGATQEKLEQFGGQTPLGRPGQPAELGSIYVQLAAADTSFATGQVYGAAGGSGQP